MPNTKSAERRMRNSARKRLHILSRLRHTEKSYRTLLATGKKDDASKVLREVISAFDKAVKSGVVHKATATRKKSRLTVALNRAK